MTKTERVCAYAGCSQSLVGRRADARHCTPKCRKRAKRLTELGLTSCPKWKPPQQLATATHCRNGHKWTPTSHRIAKDGRKMCLRCRRSRMPSTCKQGHAWTANNTRIGSQGQRVCRTCMRSWQTRWKKDNPEKIREEGQRRWKTATPAMRDKARANARMWRENNLDWALEKAQYWRAENPERVQENYRRWSADNPHSKRIRDNTRRARKANATICGPVAAADYAAVINSGPCVYCGKIATEVDHVRPLSRGGVEHPLNMVPACKSCNSGKKDRLLDEWDRVRVSKAVTVSSVVRDEWKRIRHAQKSYSKAQA